MPQPAVPASTLTSSPRRRLRMRMVTPVRDVVDQILSDAVARNSAAAEAAEREEEEALRAAGPVDPVFAWDALPAEVQARIGAAAVCLALGRSGGMNVQTDGVAYEAAEAEAFEVIDELLRAAIPRLFVGPHGLARRPDLNALGIRSCTDCGCTQAFGCEGGCDWAGPTLCSACAVGRDGGTESL